MAKDYSLGFIVGLIKAVSSSEPEVYISNMEYESDNKRFVITLNNGKKIYTPFETDSFTKEEINDLLEGLSKKDLSNIDIEDFKTKANEAGFVTSKGIRSTDFTSEYADGYIFKSNSLMSMSADGVVNMQITCTVYKAMSSNGIYNAFYINSTVEGKNIYPPNDVIVNVSVRHSGRNALSAYFNIASKAVFIGTGSTSVAVGTVLLFNLSYTV